MTNSLSQLLIYITGPLLAPAIGGLVALHKKPGHLIKSIVQHLAAGLVFAAAAVELLPALIEHKDVPPTAIGFIVGVGLLLTIRLASGGHYHGDGDENEQHQHVEQEHNSLRALVAAISIDVAVDGLLVGLGFAIGTREGQILTLAMSAEVLFLGLSTTAECRQQAMSRLKAFSITASSGIILAIFAVIGYKIAGALSGGLYQALLAFGLAALLYLVTEELLIEAHESPDEPIETACFFLGFLAILLAAM